MKSAIILALLNLLALIPRASAQTGGGGGSITIEDPLGKKTWPQIAQNIIAAMFWISVPIVSIMILIGGFQILFSAGDTEKVKSGRSTILYAVIGFIVILMANGAVALIKNILGVKG